MNELPVRASWRTNSYVTITSSELVSNGLKFMLHVPYSAIPFFGISKEHANGGLAVGTTPVFGLVIGMSSMRKTAARLARADDSCGVISAEAEAAAERTRRDVISFSRRWSQ